MNVSEPLDNRLNKSLSAPPTLLNVISSSSWSVTLIEPTVLLFSAIESEALVANTGALFTDAVVVVVEDAPVVVVLPDPPLDVLEVDEEEFVVLPVLKDSTAFAAPAAPQPDRSNSKKATPKPLNIRPCSKNRFSIY